MKELPLFDVQAPIICTIESHQKPGRRQLLEQMREMQTGVERTEDGVLLSFPRDSVGIFEEFSLAEKQCCAFFGFHLGAEELIWEAPPGASAIMDAFYAFLSDRTKSFDDLQALLS